MNSKVIIRRYQDKDLDGLFEMIKLSFLTPALDKVYEEKVKNFWLSEYSKENLIKLNEEKNLYVAEYQNRIVGSGAVGVDGDMAYLSAVFIDPNIQGKGIGSKMIDALEKDEISQKYKKLFLTAALSAGPFYIKQGYSYKYDVPEIVLDGCLDVVYMEKDLKK